MTPKFARAAGLLFSPMALAMLAPRSVLAQTTGTVRGRVTESGTSAGIADAQVSVVGTPLGSVTSDAGDFTITNVPVGARQLTVRRIGYAPRTLPVTVGAGQTARVEFRLEKSAATLDQVVVTALGQTAVARTLGAAQQTVAGQQLAESQRDNFVNALQGRVAGVEVNSSSGVPGASTSITIRGISSISSSNQPLFVIDGLPMDNKTLNTNVLASDANSNTAFNNRGVDFTNRAADIDPNDIESLTVLKGPEAAALYGIDASNGAIIITTKRGRAGAQSFQYSNSFRVSNVRGAPEEQHVYGPSGAGSSTFLYFGTPYADTTHFYDNVAAFFQTGLTQTHNLNFSGGAADGRLNYRVSSGIDRSEGVIPNSRYNRVNVTGASSGQATKWLSADLSMNYSYAVNDQPFKGDGGPLIGLLVWPANDNAADYLNAAGTRRRLTTLSQGAEVDNPFFNVAKNKLNSRNNRLIANLTFTLTPFSWGSLKQQLGSDSYTNQNLIDRNPESAFGFTNNGILDQANDVTRNLTSQTILTVNAQPILPNHLWVNGLLGNAIYDNQSNVLSLTGTNFLDPNFVSINNTSSRASLTTLGRLRRIGAFGQASFDFNHYWYVNVQGRNDWTSTIPRPKNSFFYPSVSTSFVFSDAFPSVKRFMTGRLKAAYADAGRDASPYAYTPALQYATTTGNGYTYGFYGPNRNLKPEFKKEYELGGEFAFFGDRFAIEPTYYQSTTKDQIVQNIRGSYGTGFILFNLNGATTRNQGLEMVVRGTPLQRRDLSWDVLLNFDKHHGKVLSLPHDLVESYVSDTWLYGNVRAGTMPGLSTESLTGLFYLRNKAGQILIDPTSGLPIRSADFIDAGYDRTPKYTVGVTNTIRYKKVSLDFLVDFRRGGDIFNATEQFLTARGLATSTLDRNTPRIIPGVLRDGKENSANPTPNNVVIVPAVNTGYYTNMSEELFIERNINWVWLRDVTVRYQLPARVARNASIFVTGTDLFLKTNYTGLDPMTNGNTAAVGGSGGVGIDYANFPTPRGVNFGLKLGF